MVRKKDKVYLPAGIGGLIRYGEKDESKFRVDPKKLFYFSIGIGIVLVILRFLFV